MSAIRGAHPEWTNADGIVFEPWIIGHAVGFKVSNPETDRIEYVMLNPSNIHEINPEDGCVADTFVYHLDQDAADEYHSIADADGPDRIIPELLDFGDPLIYVNHFYGAWQPLSPDDHDNTEL